eukprot:12429017-Karenia_brevis.AAC.1
MAKIQAALRRLAAAVRSTSPDLREKVVVVKPTYGQKPMRGFIRIAGMLAAQVNAEIQEEGPDIYWSLPVLEKLNLSKNNLLEAYASRISPSSADAVAWCK